jgi:hypothetical protein
VLISVAESVVTPERAVGAPNATPAERRAVANAKTTTILEKETWKRDEAGRGGVHGGPSQSLHYLFMPSGQCVGWACFAGNLISKHHERLVADGGNTRLKR